MKKAFTVTIESGSKLGKAVIMAISARDAKTQALRAAPPGFRVSKVQENSEQQRWHGKASSKTLPRGPRCSLGAVADNGNTFKGSSRSKLWVGKRKA